MTKGVGQNDQLYNKDTETNQETTAERAHPRAGKSENEKNNHHPYPGREKQSPKESVSAESYSARAESKRVPNWDPDREDTDAVKIYRRYFNYPVDVLIKDEINLQVDDLELWEDTCKYWKLNNHKAKSVGRMLSRYQEQKRERKSSNTPAAPSRNGFNFDDPAWDDLS